MRRLIQKTILIVSVAIIIVFIRFSLGVEVKGSNLSVFIYDVALMAAGVLIYKFNK
jgi:hypothetical protein